MNKNIIIGILVIIIVVLGASLFLILYEPSEEEIEGGVVVKGSSGKFIVKTSPWKPYMYEEDGEYKGISVELLDLVMQRLGIDYEFELVPWSRALVMAGAGEIDALLSAGYSLDREAFITFTDEQRAYGREGKIPEFYLHPIEGILLVRTALRDDIVFESLKQLETKKYRIGMNQGYTYDPLIEAAALNRVHHATEEESIEALMNGKIDLFLTYKEVGLALIKDMDLQNEVSVAKGPAPFKSYYFLLFSKFSDYPNIKEIQHRVDKELKKIHESGEFDEIYGKYVGGENE